MSAPIAYELHDVTRNYRDLTPQEYAKMRDDIAANGQRAPILLWHGKVIDGRHRLLISTELNRVPDVQEVSDFIKTEKQMLGLVKSFNEHRRSNTMPMTNEEKHARVAEQLLADAEKSDRAIAAMTGVSPMTVGTVRTELEANVQIGHNADRVEADGRKARGRKPGRRSNGEALAPKIRAAIAADPARSLADIAEEFDVSTKYVANLSGERSRRTGTNRKGAAKARRVFDKAIEHIFNTCEHMAEVPVPGLSAEQRAAAIHRLEAARSTLRKFCARVRETTQ